MAAYYNENDPFAAAWLRELIKDGLIADGEVDKRSIVDVQPGDLAGFTQCHFFAGIGGWSYALRLAGFPDDRECWTGSCPCQPFSSAGAQVGGHDPRHLWPAWARLISECRPVCVFGEQVESAVNHGWLDLVCDDLEREGYAVGACGLPAASVGAPHIRQRLWFVAESDGRHASPEGLQRGREYLQRPEDAMAGIVADTYDGRRRGRAQGVGRQAGNDVARGCVGVGHATAERLQGRTSGDVSRAGRRPEGRAAKPSGDAWRDVEWIPCRDGKARPTQPGLQPLAYGVPNRVGQLRGAGNAIVPAVAAAFIGAYLSTARADV